MGVRDMGDPLGVCGGGGGCRDPLGVHGGVAEGTPAVPQSFQAALQTQWSWMLQLCCCIEAHLKENTAYFQVRTAHAWLSCSVPQEHPDHCADAQPLPVPLSSKSSPRRHVLGQPCQDPA